MLSFKRIAIALLGLGLVILLVFLFINGKEPRVRFERTIAVGTNSDTLYSVLVKPQLWKKWYPIFTRDSSAKVEFQTYSNGLPQALQWESKSEGSGLIKFGYIIPKSELNYVLFVKELSVSSIVKVKIIRQNVNSTKLVWEIESTMENTFSGKFKAFLFGRVLESEVENIETNLKLYFAK